MSDYMLRDGTDDYLNFGGISAAHSETDVSRSRKTSQAGLHVSFTLSSFPGPRYPVPLANA